MSQRMKKTLLFGSIGLFLLLTLFVALKLTTPIDTTFSKWVFKLHNPVFTAFFRFITDFGYVQILLILLVIILIVFHKYRFAYILPIHVTISVIFNMILKNIRRNHLCCIMLLQEKSSLVRAAWLVVFQVYMKFHIIKDIIIFIWHTLEIRNSLSFI